jgi:hypothetical protein
MLTIWSSLVYGWYAPARRVTRKDDLTVVATIASLGVHARNGTHGVEPCEHEGLKTQAATLTRVVALGMRA